MLQISPINFGLIIAYFLPGVLSVFALSYISDGTAALFRAAQSETLNVGAIFLLVAASIVAGLIISSLRVVALEPLHHMTGVPESKTDYTKLADQQKLALYKEVVENIYRYYQFYGNVMLALLFLFVMKYVVAGIPMFDTARHSAICATNILAILVLFIASRQSLGNLCKAVGQICS